MCPRGRRQGRGRCDAECARGAVGAVLDVGTLGVRHRHGARHRLGREERPDRRRLDRDPAGQHDPPPGAVDPTARHRLDGVQRHRAGARVRPRDLALRGRAAPVLRGRRARAPQPPTLKGGGGRRAGHDGRPGIPRQEYAADAAARGEGGPSVPRAPRGRGQHRDRDRDRGRHWGPRHRPPPALGPPALGPARPG